MLQIPVTLEKGLHVRLLLNIAFKMTRVLWYVVQKCMLMLVLAYLFFMQHKSIFIQKKTQWNAWIILYSLLFFSFSECCEHVHQGRHLLITSEEDIRCSARAHLPLRVFIRTRPQDVSFFTRTGPRTQQGTLPQTELPRDVCFRRWIQGFLWETWGNYQNYVFAKYGVISLKPQLESIEAKAIYHYRAKIAKDNGDKIFLIWFMYK